MALDKKNTSLATRIFIIAVVVALVLAFAIPAGMSLFSSGEGPEDTAGGGQLELIAAQYAATIAGNDQMLASDPTSYTVLVTQGNTYFDWAIAVQQSGAQNLEDRPMWTSAVVFYDRALQAQPGDPNVSTDLAISKYYSGDTAGAIVVVEGVMEAGPDFAPGFFNAGIFYDSAAMSPQAVTAMTRYLELDSQGQYGDPALAGEIIARNGG